VRQEFDGIYLVEVVLYSTATEQTNILTIFYADLLEKVHRFGIVFI